MNLLELESQSVHAFASYERAAQVRASQGVSASQGEISAAETAFCEFHICLMRTGERGFNVRDFSLMYVIGSAAVEGLQLNPEQDGATFAKLVAAIDSARTEGIRYHASRLSAAGCAQDISHAFRYAAAPKEDEPWVIGDL